MALSGVHIINIYLTDIYPSTQLIISRTEKMDIPPDYLYLCNIRILTGAPHENNNGIR